MSSLYLKNSKVHAKKLKLAKSYKKAFKGTCGALSFKDLARRLGAGKPKGDK